MVLYGVEGMIRTPGFPVLPEDACTNTIVTTSYAANVTVRVFMIELDNDEVSRNRGKVICESILFQRIGVRVEEITGGVI